MARDPPKFKKRRTPSDDPNIIEEWRKLHKKYTVEEGMRKWPAYQRIAELYKTSTSNVEHHLDENVRLKRKQLQKNQPRPDRQTAEYRQRTATRMFAYRHIDDYVRRAFSEPPTPLTADEITLNIQDILVEEDRPPILIKNQTLLNLINKYETEQGKKLLVEVQGYEPTAYLPGK